jgi:hypothetical protein
MKKIVPVLFAACLLLSACGNQETAATPEVEIVAATEQPTEEYEVPTSAAENGQIDYFSAYEEVFQAYESILNGDRDGDYLLNNDYPIQLIYCMGSSPYDNIGYALIDLDNDGVQELLIGESAEDPFFDCLLLQMYTLEDGQVVKLLSTKEDATYQLCEDLTIAEITDSGIVHYAYSNGTFDEVSSDSAAQAVSYTAFSFYEQFIK